MIPEDLNCDLGEGESVALTRALLTSATSANIACGGHAGDLDAMQRTVDLALNMGVRIGAHPGLPDRNGFGRSGGHTTPAAMADLVVRQTAALEVVCRLRGASLHHVKLHGALYHMAESRMVLARAAARAIRDYFPGVAIYAFAGGNLQESAEALGVDVWPEAFADRHYTDGGKLVRRSHPDALVTDPRVAVERFHHLARFGEILSLRGHPVRVRARTLCVHSDSPGAKKILTLLRQAMDAGSPDGGLMLP